MTLTQFIVETIATIIELWLILSTVLGISGSKYSGMEKQVRIIISALGLTVFVSVLNSFQLFSFVTVLSSVLLILFITKFLTDKSTVLRAFATILVFLSIHAVDYIVLFVLGMLTESPITNIYTFSVLFEFGIQRCLYLLIVKIIDLSLYTIAKKHFSQLQLIPQRHMTVLLIMVTIAYGVMSALLSLILSDSMAGMQLAVIFSWLFILLCVCATLCFSYITAKYQEEKTQNEMLAMCNSMMEKNYQRLHASQQATARLIHDFNHHLGALRELARQHESNEISEYIDSLLEIHYRGLPMCKSGNDVINAIINYKVGQAQEYHIKFQYRIDVDVPPLLHSVDLCSILANQIDNAFDACKQIDDHSQRIVDVHIWQNSDNLFLFQVMNKVECDPFKQNPELQSTKTDNSHPHGLGVKCIKDTAEKYNGALVNNYHDGRFFSTVFLDLNPNYRQEDEKC